MRPRGGRRGTSGEERRFRALVLAQTNDRKVFVRFEAVVEQSKLDNIRNRPIALLAIRSHGGPRADAIVRLNVLLCLGHQLKRGRRIQFLLLSNVAESLQFAGRGRPNHLTHRGEARTVDVNFVARLRDRAAVDRVVMGNSVFGAKTGDAALLVDGDRMIASTAVA